MPNLLFPALSAVPLSHAGATWLLLPPPQAWGTSNPWPYRDGPDWSLGLACRTLLQAFLAADLTRLPARRRELALEAAVALFVEEQLGPADGRAYILQSGRERGLADLDRTVDALRRACAAAATVDLPALAARPGERPPGS